jgi:pimeloyl-ACP methyl ester carboxylesterase
VEARESTIGSLPCLVAGVGDPLVVLAGLMPQAGVADGPLRSTHEAAMRPWTHGHEVHYVNLRPGFPRGITMSAIAVEYARGIEETFGGPVDVLGMSTGGSIAQQLAAQHPGVIRRLVLLSTACRLGSTTRLGQRRVAARIRAGAIGKATALMAGELAPPGPWWLPVVLAGRVLGPRLFPVDGLQDMATMIEAEDSFDLAGLPQVQAPTLLVAGGRDRFYPPELFIETAGLIPGCRLELHRRRGHITVTARPRAVAQVLGFLGQRAG